ncbi:CapA family protein [Tessaracoccus rhinocerotis]|uniref:CapA family protein n=1 Tax=Tessaracoccus rhinocerotis TaxID=1689449 RepID=UPI00163DA64B|nr:CapA family protein [Tessaracoccus rhinocerotis]
MTINFSGDLLWHDTLWESARVDGGGSMDFAPQLAALEERVGAADVAICHSEVPFAEAGGPYSDYPMFKAPQEIAPALAGVGWDVCTTASNHSLDAGLAGLARNIEVHRANGILTAGTYASAEDRNTPVVLTTADGVGVAVVSSTYGTNGIPLPEDAPWSVSLMDVEDTLAQAARARSAGADIVVVHMHAGTEYESTPSQQQVAFATALTASEDVDLVIGQHAHVVQPVTRMNGKWVAYGAGNLMAQSGPAQPWTYDGYLATFTFSERADGTFTSTSGEFAPTMITKYRPGSPARVLVVSDALAAANAQDAKLLRESAARTRAIVLSAGVEGLVER